MGAECSVKYSVDVSAIFDGLRRFIRRDCVRDPAALMCGRSHAPDKVRVVREEVGSRRRGEDRKKWSFSLCVCLVCGNCPRRGVRRMPSLFPVRNGPSKAAAVCPSARFWDFVRAHQRSALTFSGTPKPSAPLFGPRGPPADASPLLSPIESRRHNGVKRWERNSSGNGRKSGADTARDGARGWRRTTR